MAKAGGGGTVVVAQTGGGPSGGSSGGGGGSGSGITTNPRSKDPLNSKLKIEDNLFWTAMMAAAGFGLLVHMYYQNPNMFHGFIDPIRNAISGQPTIPPAPAGTTQTDTLPQQQVPDPMAGQFGGQMQFPEFPQQNQGAGYPQFQMPQQPQYPQQYQGYDPSGFGGGNFGDMSAGSQPEMTTQFNPMFNQNSNMQSFRVKHYDFDSSDGMLRVSRSYVAIR